MKKFKVVIFGTGKSAISHITNLKKNRKVKIEGVFGSNKKRLSIIKKKYKINIFKNKNKIFKNKPDISLIANQNFRHYPDTLTSLKNGCDVLVEKPLTTDVNKTKELIKFAKKNKKKLAVVLQRRLDDSSIYLKKLIKKKFFGNLIFIKLNIFMNRDNNYFNKLYWLKDKKKSGGGILIHHAIHSIDQLLFILEKKPMNIKTFISNQIMKMKIEDTAVGIIKFEDNILTSINATYCASKNIRNSIEFYGDKKSMIFSGDKLTTIGNKKNKLHKNFSIKSRGTYQKIWSNFILNKKNTFDADNYLKTELLIKKMYS